jgi:hypothetical protein
MKQDKNLDSLRLLLTPAGAISQLSALSRSIFSKDVGDMDLTVRMRREGKKDAWKFVMSPPMWAKSRCN